MKNKSKIEWTDRTWNPTLGCSMVSKGCTNCYAMRFAHRFRTSAKNPLKGLTTDDVKWNGDVKLMADRIEDPISWTKPSMIFVGSMSDIFHESVPDVYLLRIFHTMYLADHHTFQVLTKRPERMASFTRRLWCYKVTGELRLADDEDHDKGHVALPNVWMGTSVENQDAADERIPELLRAEAAVRFVSCEPLIGPVDLKREDLPKLDWVIVGGESGPGARAMHPCWARGLRDVCDDADVPFLFKQWGAWLPFQAFGDVDDWPSFLPDDNNRPVIHLDSARIITLDGTLTDLNDYNDASASPKWLSFLIARVGKKKSGRLLDGQKWDQYPPRDRD